MSCARPNRRESSDIVEDVVLALPVRVKNLSSCCETWRPRPYFILIASEINFEYAVFPYFMGLKIADLHHHDFPVAQNWKCIVLSDFFYMIRVV